MEVLSLSMMWAGGHLLARCIPHCEISIRSNTTFYYPSFRNTISLVMQLARFFYSGGASWTAEEPAYSDVLSPALRRMMLLPSMQYDFCPNFKVPNIIMHSSRVTHQDI